MSNKLANSLKSGEIVKLTQEEMDNYIREALLEWLDSSEKLNDSAKDELINRINQIRLKMQVLFVEMQKRFVRELYFDAEFESVLKQEIRKNLPYMTADEKNKVLVNFNATNQDKADRLERQLAGFDLFSNVEFALQSLSEVKVPQDIKDKVKDLDPSRRRKLLNVIDEIKSSIEKETKDNEQTNTSEQS